MSFVAAPFLITGTLQFLSDYKGPLTLILTTRTFGMKLSLVIYSDETLHKNARVHHEKSIHYKNRWFKITIDYIYYVAFFNPAIAVMPQIDNGK